MHYFKLLLILSLTCISFNTQIIAEDDVGHSKLYINQAEANLHFDNANLQQAYSHLLTNLSRDTNHKATPFYHVIKDIEKDEGFFFDGSSTITLTDLSTWEIGYFYNTKNWQPGDHLKISYHSSYTSNDMKIENIDRNSTAWGTIKQGPALDKRDFIQDIYHEKDVYHMTLNSNNHFTSSISNLWSIGDHIFILHTDNGYRLWNLTQGKIMTCTLTKCGGPTILQLEKKLNDRVLAQSEATKAVSTALVNYTAGLNDPNVPIGVFLFLGPTGTGKTELAKVVAAEFYGSQDKLTRFDMSHFTESHSVSRLIGSPQGYEGYQEGGQLTNALKEKPQSIVLLDEIEKAHPQVRKMFLPIFDEGFVRDTNIEGYGIVTNRLILTSTALRNVNNLTVRGITAQCKIHGVNAYKKEYFLL